MVYTILAEGFEEIEALAVVDILRRADIDIKTVSASGEKTVKGAHGIEVTADETEFSKEYDVLFLPGGYPGYVNLENNAKVISLIKDADSKGKIIAAICAAPSILGKLGILSGKTACCYPSFEQDLKGAKVVFDDVAADGNIITSRGAGTAHKLAFKLVEIIRGKECANELSKGMIYN